jgi:crossover junction endodeoxyribonuclease RuvC
MSGGIAAISQEALIVEPMPSTEHDTNKFFWSLVQVGLPIKAVIEKVHAMPSQGVSSSFTFGKGYGFLRGCLVSNGIPFEEVTPQAWQKYLQIPPAGKNTPKREHKLKLKSLAQQLFPKLPIWSTPKTLGVQLAICDALLIAEYARRTR